MEPAWAMEATTKSSEHVLVLILLSSHPSFLRFPVSLAFIPPLSPAAFPALVGSCSAISQTSLPPCFLNTGVAEEPLCNILPGEGGLTGSAGFHFHLYSDDF